MKALILMLGWLLITILAFLVSGCNPVFYAPNAHNVPLFKEKNEIRMNATLAVTDDLAGHDIQLAYAVGKNIGIIANGTYLESSGSTWSGYGFLTEAGAGYFRPVGSNFVMEIYGGGGYSEASNERQSSPYTVLETDFTKFFVQPGFGFTSKYFEIAISPKIALVRFSEPLINAFQTDTPDGTYINYQYGYPAYSATNARQNFLVFEPALTVRGGIKNVKLHLQVVQSDQKIPNSQDLNINLGLSVNLAKRFRKVAE